MKNNKAKKISQEYESKIELKPKSTPEPKHELKHVSKSELTPMPASESKHGSKQDLKSISNISTKAQTPITRRQFIIGAAATATTAAAIGTAGLTGCAPTNDEEINLTEINPLNVDPSQVIIVSETEELSADECITQVNSYDLPLGSLLYMDCDAFSLVINPADTNDILTQIGFLSIPNGTLTYVLREAVSLSEGYVIYDARANDKIIVWCECNLHTNNWRLYVSSVFSSAEIGAPQLVDEGDVDFDPPMLSVAGDKAFWTYLPNEDGGASDSDSYLKSIKMGEREPTTEYTSPGRMITNPESSDGIVTFVPRSDSDSVLYQMTALSSSDSKIVDAELLPKSMRCNECIYIDQTFVFGIESSYDFGGGIADFGTYLRVNNTYLRFNKTPTDTPAFCEKYLFVRGDKSIIGVDYKGDSIRHFTIDTLSENAPFGDFLASTGSRDRIVVFTTVKNTDGSGDGITKVRVFEVK